LSGASVVTVLYKREGDCYIFPAILCFYFVTSTRCFDCVGIRVER